MEVLHEGWITKSPPLERTGYSLFKAVSLQFTLFRMALFHKQGVVDTLQTRPLLITCLNIYFHLLAYAFHLFIQIFRVIIPTVVIATYQKP